MAEKGHDFSMQQKSALEKQETATCVTSEVATSNNWRGEIYLCTDLKNNLFQTDDVRHYIWIFAPPIIDVGYATVRHLQARQFNRSKNALGPKVEMIMKGYSP